MEKRWIKILALFPALSLNNYNEDILCDFKTLGLVLFWLFCVWVIQDHLNNAGLSFPLSSHSWQKGVEDAFTELQCLIHIVCATGQALYVQRNEKEFYYANHILSPQYYHGHVGTEKMQQTLPTNCWQAGILQMRGLLLCRGTCSGFTTSHHRATTDCALPARSQGRGIPVISELTGLWLQIKTCNFGLFKKKKRRGKQATLITSWEISQHTVSLYRDSASKILHKMLV